MRAANARIFGLLDGEVAASLNATQVLLDCNDTLFTLTGSEGLIFLGAHELENLYLGWADVPTVVAHHHAAARLHLHPPAAVSRTLDGLITRFLKASLYKYTSAHFHAAGAMRNILSARIFAQGSAATIRTTVRAAVTSGNGVTWQTFVAELVRVGHMARTASRRASSVPSGRRGWLLRIADGKELLARLRQLHGQIGDDVEGALLRDLCRSPYPAMFRDALFRLTGVTPSTATV